MTDSGFEGRELYDVCDAINTVIRETQPHAISLMEILKDNLIGSTVFHKDDHEPLLVINVTVMSSKKDPNGVKIIAHTLDTEGEIKLIWIQAGEMYRSLVNDQGLKVNFIKKDSLEDYLRRSGVKIPKNGITMEEFKEWSQKLAGGTAIEDVTFHDEDEIDLDQGLDID